MCSAYTYTPTNENKLKSTMADAGYIDSVKMADSLQGSVWRARQACNNLDVVIKVTNKSLHKQQMIIAEGIKYRVCENIVNEIAILKYLSTDKTGPNCIVKYLNEFESNINYYLIMTNGGQSLLEFTQRVHQYINAGKILISEWQKLVRLIFKQMIQSIEYLHSKQICHFDISVENFLIHNINVKYSHDRNMFNFCFDDEMQIRLCDFGVSEHYPNGDYSSSKYCGKQAYKSPEITSRAKVFNAKKNDIFAVGVCLFTLLTGVRPWIVADKNDKFFADIMNGNLIQLLKNNNRAKYVTKDLIELLNGFFQYEDKRVNIEQIKKCTWFQYS